MRIIDGAGIAEQINLAIGVHGLWKTRIAEAINHGTSDWDPEFVSPSCNCDFGKWLDNLEESRKDGLYEEIVEIHTNFHLEASRVLKLALEDKKEEALASVGDGSLYQSLTTNLTITMMTWKKAIG